MTITKTTPRISTSQQPASATVGSTALNDKITLAGLVDPVTSGTGVGKITVKLFPPSQSTCTGTAAFTQVITATSGNGTYTTTGGPTAETAGTWQWTASYSGDANNNGATSLCSSEPVTITKATPGISTTPQPASATVGSTTLNDKVTLSGLVDPVTSGPGVGKITVKLYAPTHSTCIGTAAFTQVITATSGNGTYTTTGGPTANVTGVWHWTASYSGDANNNGATSLCSSEPVTITKATPGISTTPQPASATVGSTTLNDKVTLSGLVDPVTSGPGVGKITVKLYAPTHSTCIGTAAFTQVITATSGNGTYATTGGPTADVTGVWHWTASYSGDANNNGATSLCSSEPVTITKATPGISTSPQPASATVGSTTLNDKVTLSGLVDPVTSGPGVGQITVKLYAPTHSTCIGTAAFTQVITATSGNGTYTTTGGPTAETAGTWHWTASYSGDANNNVATSLCSSEPVTITKATPGISTSPQPASATVGSNTLNDKVTLSGLVNPVTSGPGVGKITVKLYTPSHSTCTGTAAFTQVITATSGNGTYTTTGGPTANLTGTWQWTASYSGDVNNNVATSLCSSEPVTVTKTTPGISTSPQPASATVGSTTLNDKITLSGLVDPITSGPGVGKITVKLYTPSHSMCTGTGVHPGHHSDHRQRDIHHHRWPDSQPDRDLAVDGVLLR